MDPRTRQPFPLVPRRRLAGLPFGASLSLHRGRGADVAGSRPYRRGDPLATIDWRASARLSTSRGDDEFVVRERFADEAPRAVVLCDRRPSMALYPPPLPWLDKPAAARAAVEAVVLSAVAARGAVGYLDQAEGGADPFWLAPRGRAEWRRIGARHDAAPGFAAPEDALERGLAFLARHRTDIPAGSFLFVVSDFLAPPSPGAWAAALAHGWEIVPVVIQDPVWEQSFPVLGRLVLPLADPRDGRVLEVRLSRAEAAARRRESEAARAALLAGLASLGLDPVLLETGEPARVDSAFLDWAARRSALRRRR